MVKTGTILVSSSVRGEHLPKISDPIRHLLGCHFSWDVASCGAHLDKHQTRAFEALCFGGLRVVSVPSSLRVYSVVWTLLLANGKSSISRRPLLGGRC